MVRIQLDYTTSGHLVGIHCIGHAGFSDQEHGGDIVCAAISALTGYLGLTFSTVLELPESVEASHGEFRLRIAESTARTQEPMLLGWVLAVRELAENYQGWVQVERREVSDQGP